MHANVPLPMCLEEFRRAVNRNGLTLSDDPPGFESRVHTPWGTSIPVVANIDPVSEVGQVNYLDWWLEVAAELNNPAANPVNQVFGRR